MSTRKKKKKNRTRQPYNLSFNSDTYKFFSNYLKLIKRRVEVTKFHLSIRRIEMNSFMYKRKQKCVSANCFSPKVLQLMASK